MKRTLIILSVLVVVVVFFIKISNLFSQDIDYQKLAQLWDVFLQDPSETNISSLYELLPLKERIDVPDNQKELLEKIIGNLNVLEASLYEGNEKFVKFIFGLYCFKDEKIVSSVNRLLCNLLAFKPEIFLKELKNKRDMVPNLEALLGAYKFIAAETGNSEEVEKNLRLKALEGIEDKDLKDLKKECVKILKKL